MSIEKARELITTAYNSMIGSNCIEEEQLKHALAELEQPKPELTKTEKKLKWYKDLARHVVWYKKIHAPTMNPDYSKQYHEITNFVDNRYPYYEGIEDNQAEPERPKVKMYDGRPEMDRIKSRLDKLEQPEQKKQPCKRCGNTGIANDNELGDTTLRDYPCPDCQKQELSEFTKEIRELIKTKDDDKGWERLEGYIAWLEIKLRISCDIIDRLEAENKRLKETLDRLARLGNEPNYGNSIGNVIAQEALKEKNNE